MGGIYRRAGAAAALAAGIAVAGCGLPGAPLPPTLNLPQPVTDLSAARAGNQVSLAWTMPIRNTDKLLLKGSIAVRVCRRESNEANCAAAGSLQLEPGATGTFTETLPAPLTTNTSRVLTYFVELNNSNGRSAGLSNGASVLAGEAPPAITGLSAEMARTGVLLHWNPVPPGQEPGPTVVRLERTLVSPPPAKPEKGLFAPPAESTVQNLLVPADSTPGVALDKDIRFGETYEFRAQRILRITVGGKDLELPSALSLPVRIHAVNAFPPAVPTGLVAVATPAHDNVPASIDLSWQPDTEPDLGGYIVYRREKEEPWQRVSPSQPVVGPAFDDAHVEPGHTYIYAVSALSTGGLESARSAEAQETVPNQ